jgi:hypothetical protein
MTSTSTSTNTNLHIALNVTYAVDYDASDVANGIYIVDYMGDGLPTLRKTLEAADLSEDDKKAMLFHCVPYMEWYKLNPEVFPPATTMVPPFPTRTE